MVTEPLSWKTMNSVKISIMIMWMDSALVGFLQVMADMKELSVREVVTEIPILYVSCHESCEPIISNTNWWFDLFLAAILKTSFVKDSNLENHMSWSIALIRSGEDISIM